MSFLPALPRSQSSKREHCYSLGLTLPRTPPHQVQEHSPVSSETAKTVASRILHIFSKYRCIASPALSLSSESTNFTVFNMPHKSPYPPLLIPQTDILSFLFPPGQSPSTDPIWIDSKDPCVSLSPAQLLQWVKRLAFALGRAGVKKGEVVMIHTPNHVFVPVAYLGIVGGGFAFSGTNPVYTVPGE